jgi:hypothetical protein
VQSVAAFEHSRGSQSSHAQDPLLLPSQSQAVLLHPRAAHAAVHSVTLTGVHDVLWILQIALEVLFEQSTPPSKAIQSLVARLQLSVPQPVHAQEAGPLA